MIRPNCILKVDRHLKTLLASLFFLGLQYPFSNGQVLHIEFDPRFSPPVKIPYDAKERIYSIPVNQFTGQPIIAYLKDQKGNLYQSNDPIVAYYTAMGKPQLNLHSPEPWKDSGGRFCQRSAPRIDYPMRYNPELQTMKCGNNLSNTTRTGIVINGRMIIDNFMYYHPKGEIPGPNRFMRINIYKFKIWKDTNYYRVTKPANHLVITKEPPSQITVNTPFEIKVEIRDNKGAVLTDGLDSVANVQLTVCFDYKFFYHSFGKDMMLKSALVRLGGSSVTVYASTGDLVIRKQAIKGKVSFPDVRILDAVNGLTLNLTVTQSIAPYLRIPYCMDCNKDYDYKVVKDNLVRFYTPPTSVMKDIGSIAITRPFDVVFQTFAKLKYISDFKGPGKMVVSRNFPIPYICIEIQDANGNRIYAGPDSKLALVTKVSPASTCLSKDHSLLSNEGIAIFIGSICEIIKSVRLTFYPKKYPSISVTSPEIDIVGDVNIAHFDNFQFTGAGREVSPHINSFIRFAAIDANNNVLPVFLKQHNITLKIITIETQNDIAHAVHEYRNLRKIEKQNPNEALHAAIFSGNPNIGSSLFREMVYENKTVISLDEKNIIYTKEDYFHRVCWNAKQVFDSFSKYTHQRYWYEMIILKTTDSTVDDYFFNLGIDKFADFHEILIDEMSIDWLSDDPDAKEILSHVMAIIKMERVKIIVCFASPEEVPAILRIAQEESVTSVHGYQWIFVSDFAWSYPFENLYSCKLEPKCSNYFLGTLLFMETYNTSFMQTKDWERVMTYYYTVDRTTYLGLDPVDPNEYARNHMALGYDATWLYAKALGNIVNEKLTVTAERINHELRRVEIYGLSGYLKLDKDGDRVGFLANVRVVNTSETDGTIDKVAPLYKLIKWKNEVNRELLYKHKNSAGKFALPKAPRYNVATFNSMTGRVSNKTLIFFRQANETWPPVNWNRRELVVPPYSCNQPCGKLITKDNINEYDRGNCTAMGSCQCLPGFKGISCGEKLCSCKHGWCDVPLVCSCFPGYTGNYCTIPLCLGGCGIGKCLRPDWCECYSYSWVGRNCHIHVIEIIVPFFIVLGMLIYISYIFYVLTKMRIEHTRAIANINWLVDWEEVVRQDKSSHARRKVENMIGNSPDTLYVWKYKKWYMKRIHSYTIDYFDENVRLEMVELINMSHQNVIVFGGACLVYPNVGFLEEATPKGSLEDILIGTTIQLDWNFRFSFMKDICCGMNYLHNKALINSHGRLKSSNCLLDNRWCIKITDFGAPTIRYGPYMIEKSNLEVVEEYNKMQLALLWTAPELLERATCLDDVKIGTKQGDIYSFGIIVSEIATRKVPFAFEREYLSVSALIDLIVDRDAEAMENEYEIWLSLGNELNEPVRPFIMSDQLPDGRPEKAKFRKMLADIWADDPQVRPTFSKLHTILDQIFPTKGELMDNLMQLLESYSKNLERIVIERTEILQAETAKVENIVSQMLPKKVIQELKNGSVVEPENFECVTVYYSDLVGFTTIAMNSLPMQVVDLLNDLYSVFDNILAQYDVYKVETIGDAYVVSSGVPTLNGNLHAGEISTVSLDMMSAIMAKTIPHLPNNKLQLRLGINTGPVVAGVVGLKMPRYTLFGETMQIASLMESSSKPMHIQITEYTVKVLQGLGGYFILPRGQTEFCGKTIKTYWLLGKDGYNKPLPDFNPD